MKNEQKLIHLERLIKGKKNKMSDLRLEIESLKDLFMDELNDTTVNSAVETINKCGDKLKEINIANSLINVENLKVDGCYVSGTGYLEIYCIYRRDPYTIYVNYSKNNNLENFNYGKHHIEDKDSKCIWESFNLDSVSDFFKLIGGLND